VDNVIEIGVMLGGDGQNSNIELFTLPSIDSPDRAAIELSADILNYIINDATYVEIRTRTYPFGVIRGEFLVVDSCEPIRDLQVSAYESSDSVGSLQSSDTSILTYLSYLDKDDDEFDVYVEVINSSNIIFMSFSLSLLCLLLI